MVGSLRHVRAAQLRAKALRWAIGRVVLGSVFLIGALAYSLAPDRHDRTSVFWMSLLLVMSTYYVAVGLRSIARVRHRPRRLWIAASAAWGGLSLALLVILMRDRP
jgi:hypothetical protein